MKPSRIFFAVAAAVLAGCSSAPAAAPVAPSPAVSVTTTAATVASPSAVGAFITDAEYLHLVRDQGWVGAGVTDAQLLTHGRTACDALKSMPPDGAAMTSWKAAVRVMTANGMPADDAVEFLVYATSRFCPETQGVYLPGNPG